MSVLNLAGLLSHELGALLTHRLGVTETNFEHLWLLVTLTNASTLLPLPLLLWLPDTSAMGEGITASAYQATIETSDDLTNAKPKESLSDRLDAPLALPLSVGVPEHDPSS
jgi:hypothetical protein